MFRPNTIRRFNNIHIKANCDLIMEQKLLNKIKMLEEGNDKLKKQLENYNDNCLDQREILSKIEIHTKIITFINIFNLIIPSVMFFSVK